MAPDSVERQSLELMSDSPTRTRWLGARLGELLTGGEVICLEGDLGTGKTTLTQGIGHGLGISQPIISPTFTLIREYTSPAGRPSLYHIDFYRLDRAQEFTALGLDDYLYGEGVCVIEWAEKAAMLLPIERLWITMNYVSQGARHLLLVAAGRQHLDLLQRFREVLAEEQVCDPGH